MVKKIERAAGRPPTPRLGAAIALGLAAALAAAPARSQPADRRREREARALFERGIERADRRRWAEALEAFERSLAVMPRPTTRFNIAQALLRLGRHRDAVAAFEAYLAAPEGDRDAGRAAEARALLAESRAHVGTLTLTDVPDGAEVLVDGAAVPGAGATRALTLDPGTRHLEVRAGAGRSERFDVALEAGARATRAVTSAPAGHAVARPTLTGAQAQAAFERGRLALLGRRYDDAARAFEEAAALEPTPGTWRWLGVTLRSMGRYVDGIAAFERYAAAPEPAATPEQRAQVQEALRAMRLALARVEVSPPAGASLLVDGRERRVEEGVVSLDPGPHAIELRAEGHRPQRHDVDLAPGGRLTLRAHLEPLPARVAVEPSVAAAQVTIDGLAAGRGRVEREVAPGEHALEISADGYEPLRRTVRVAAGAAVRVDATLVRRRLPGWVVPVAVAGGLLVAGGLTAAVVLATRGTEPPLPTSWGNFAEALTLP